MVEINKNVFDPSLLSFPDCDYLLAHAGEQPVVALKNVPANCNRYTMKQWIDRFYELDELAKAGFGDWAGIESVKATIQTYLDVREQWRKEESYGAPRNPSMYSFDTRGNAHYSAPGSDSGRVKTYFDDKGNRLPFALNLIDNSSTGKWKPVWVRDNKPVEKPAVIEPTGKNVIECGVEGCGHTETYRPESRSSYNVARGRLSRHMRRAQFEPQAHLEMHSLEFGSSE